MPEPSVAAPSVAAPTPSQGPTSVSVPSTDFTQGPSSIPEMRDNAPMSDAFSDLDKMFGEPVAKEPTEPVKPDSQDKPDKTPEPPPKPDDKQKAQDKSTDKPEKTGTVPELRKAYENLKKEHAALKAEMSSKAKPQEESQQAQAQLKTISERLEAAEKRNRELEDEIKYSAYERSPEYKDKYEQPFIDAYQAGMTKTSSFKVTDSEGNVRQGTGEDFDRIMQIASDEDAANAARELFGETKASIILMHREKILDLHASRVKAIESFRKNGSEREKLTAEQRDRQQKALGEAWTKLNNEAAEKYPDWFKEKDGDDKGNDLLRKGYELADLAFNGSNNLTPEQTVQLHSSLRNRAAAFGRLAYQNRNLSARVAELEKELEQFKSSEPGKADGAKPNGLIEDTSWEAALDKLAV